MADNSRSDDAEEEVAKPSLLGDAMKKILTVGVTGAFLAEETLKQYLSDTKLPKDVLNTLLQGALRQKEEFAQKIAKEATQVISKIDFVKEATRFLETHKMKVSAEIDFTKKESGKE